MLLAREDAQTAIGVGSKAHSPAITGKPKHAT
jgi:hypothetical protein